MTFLKTAAQTNGEYTLVEVELADGGGVGAHFHKMYSEKFRCLEGKVQVGVAKTVHTLQPSESVIAIAHTVHFFRNRSGGPCRFRVELRPASRGFEQSLQIGYGLAKDGLCKRTDFLKTGSRLRGCFP